MNELLTLVEEYKNSDKIFHAGRYWQAYEDGIIAEIEKARLEELRSGKYPIFGTFGFFESVYHYHHDQSRLRKLLLKIIRSLFITNRSTLPYSISISDIREMAYTHCLLQGEIAKLKPISEIEVSTYGNPNDLFEIKGKKYTMAFLSNYIRLCYAQKHINLIGNEIVVELGSGSGHQVEVLKKVFPDLTILCFDLPYTLYLGYKYLSKSLGKGVVINPIKNIKISDPKSIEKGKVSMFGNWQFPILKEYKFDVFWNAASFGEMEPHIVNNYLSYILNNCKSIYLLQARMGKESSKDKGVVKPISLDDYNSFLKGYKMIDEADAYQAHRKMSQSGGYFQSVWQIED